MGSPVPTVLTVQARLTNRDLVLLGWLHEHQVLTTFQIANALFPSLGFAQRRLLVLVELGLLDRFRPQRPDGGTYPYHYVLDQLGLDVITAQRADPDPPRRVVARQRRWYLTNRANLPHLLGVNQFFTDLAGVARRTPNARLERWWSAGKCATNGAFTEPRHPTIGVYYLPVHPDGHGIWNQDGHRTPFWFEYDNSTEPHTVLLNKITRYGRPLRQRALTDTSDITNWPVLFSFATATRETHFHHHLARAGLDVPVATLNREHLAATGLDPTGPVWWTHPVSRDADQDTDQSADQSAEVVSHSERTTHGFRRPLNALYTPPGAIDPQAATAPDSLAATTDDADADAEPEEEPEDDDVGMDDW